MENTAYLRRQAVFCLRLSELFSDPPLVAHLTVKAAQFHERALRAELACEFDLDEHALERAPEIVPSLLDEDKVGEAMTL